MRVEENPPQPPLWKGIKKVAEQEHEEEITPP